ncbi:LutC/YkgG family protein [Streptomyces meridianus]|uniref:Lactate utilization protein n=1 Tax=Streptomyces meridianus TaxID=2938945 RepID=A0ABT0XDK7_9ACTN|nr:lactate utilization protein [Streptomyces meridianus]MCM2580613.1 lactate utilization protein [Streptomyces meridianus]
MTGEDPSSGAHAEDAGAEASRPSFPVRFAAELERVGGRCHHVPDRAAARTVVARLCGDGTVVADADPLVAEVTDGLRRVENPWEADTGVTTALAAVADTGSLALVHDREHPRRNSVVPPVHIALVPVPALVGSYADAIVRLAAVRPAPSGMRMVTGPSSSGDIEMVQVRGMHGPLALHVVLIGAADSRASGSGAPEVASE